MRAGRDPRVRDAEIVERHEHTPLYGFKEAEFRSDVPTKIRKDISPIHALRCSRETKQNLGLIIIEELPVALRGGVVDFIDDDVIIGVFRRLFPPFSGFECLD